MGQGFSATGNFPGRAETTTQTVKLDAAKEALLREVAGLDPNCDVAIFAFDDKVELLFQGSPNDRATFEPIVRAVVHRGETNIAGALDASLPFVERYQRIDSLIITDGLSNVGDPVAAARRCYEKGISISVVLIDPTDEGQTIARSIALGGRVYAVTSAAQLDTELGDAGIRQQLRFERDERGRLEHNLFAKLSSVQEDLASAISKNFGTLAQRLEGFEGNFYERIGGLSRLVDANRLQSASLSSELHTLLAAVSLGVPLDQFPMPRYMPVRVYLKEGSRESLRPVTNHIERFSAELRFEIADDFPVEEGSFWKRWFVKSREALSTEEVQERLRKLERAAELQVLDKPQAAVDKDLATAASELIRAVEHEREAAIQIGSLLILKVPEGRNSRVMVRTLSAKEMIAIERRPDSLKDPTKLLTMLNGERTDEATARLHNASGNPADVPRLGRPRKDRGR